MNKELITRREAVALAAAMVPAASGQRQFGSMLWDYIREYTRLLDERRARRLASLESEDDFLALRDTVRGALKEMWGPFPERTPLNAKHVGTVECGDHIIERLVYESRPSFHVTANLYRPTAPDEGLPAVIFPCGHGEGGKTAETYRRFATLMARNGFAVLIWDPLGQGERLQFPGPDQGTSEFRQGTGEHRILGDRCYLAGENLMQYRVWDATRALDYLEVRPEIDTARIGIAGQSGGGMAALQFACFDDRIQAAFISCAVASFRTKTEALLIADPEQVLFGTLREGIDHPELLAAFAPKPLAIGAALRDYVPIHGARRTHGELQAVYRKLGRPGNLHWAETDAGHGMNRELREAAASFFCDALAGRDEISRELDGALPAASELLCTASGQVSGSLQSRNVENFYRKKADSIAPRFEMPSGASEFEVYRSVLASRIREVTRVGAFKSEFGVDVPTRFLDAGVYAKGAVFLVAEQGKDHPLVRRYCIDAVVAANHSLYGVDVRGWGATAPSLPSVDVSFDWDDFLAYRSLELGRPLFGQRLKDLLATAPTMTKRHEWMVVGIGIGGLLAAHAAALDSRIAGVISIQAPLSYRAMLDDPHSSHPVSCFLPGVTGAYEIEDVYAASAPRPLLIINPEDARGAAMATDAAKDMVGRAFEIYEVLEAADSIRVESGLGRAEIRTLIEEWLRSVAS